jgi:hypothetical protein
VARRSRSGGKHLKLACDEDHLAGFTPADYATELDDIEAVDETRGLFREVIGTGSSSLHAYFHSDRSGAWFERLEPSPPNGFTPTDLLSVELLDVSLPGGLIRDLLIDTDLRRLATERLADIHDVAIWDADAPPSLGIADELWHLIDRHVAVCLRGSEGVGDAKLSKLLCRKRPSLIPITDSVVRPLERTHHANDASKPLATVPHRTPARSRHHQRAH